MTRRTRPRGFAPWNPRSESLALVRDVQAVLDEYRKHLPLTIRQAFYRLVAMRDFPKTETACARLCETVSRARRAGLIPFASIRDDGAARYEFTGGANPAGFLDDVLSGILRDAITARRDNDATAEMLALESEYRAALLEKLGAAQ